METKLPITEYEDNLDGRTNTEKKGAIPLCPWCKEWSYYTTESAKQNDGVHYCLHCNGAMYMPAEKPSQD